MWEIQNPSVFYTFAIPFEMEGDTKVGFTIFIIIL